MKKLIVLIVIGVAGLVGYNYYTTGEISLMPPSSLSKEERELKRLEKDFHKAQNKFFGRDPVHSLQQYNFRVGKDEG